MPLQSRHDVLTYQTKALEDEVELTGPVEMRLWASSSALDTDFTAKLIDVYPPSSNFPDGLAFNITDSIIRARYRNPNTGNSLGVDRSYSVATQTIYHEPDRASCVVLPLQSIDPK